MRAPQFWKEHEEETITSDPNRTQPDRSMEAEGGNKRRPWARRAQSALRMGVLCCALAQLPRARSGCWKPAKFIEHMCKDAESNVLPIYEAPDSSRRRHLLW